MCAVQAYRSIGVEHCAERREEEGNIVQRGGRRRGTSCREKGGGGEHRAERREEGNIVQREGRRFARSARLLILATSCPTHLYPSLDPIASDNTVPRKDSEKP